MATLGYSTTPSFGNFWFAGPGAENQCNTGGVYTMPAGGGTITEIHAYFDVENGGPVTCWLCVWNGSGLLLGSQSIASIPNGSNSAGGQAWHSVTLNTPFFVAGGTNIFPGFQTPEANGFTTSFDSSGSSSKGQNATNPGNFTGGVSSGHGVIGAYVVYTPGSGHIYRSGAWTTLSAVKMYRSGAWTTVSSIKMYRSGSWVPTS